MRLGCIAASGAALGVALVMVPLLTGATGLPMDSTGAVVLRGTEGVVRRLPYMQDQIYDLTVADRTLLAIDFPDGEHIKAIAQSTAPVFHVQQRGDTLQVAAERPGEKMGLNVITRAACITWKSRLSAIRCRLPASCISLRRETAA
jgi:hypothetical protein